MIELKTCIQAIVSASPELVVRLGQDYTVYAYDYSEYETPLVGQGMLSWLFASASSTPMAPAHQSRTFVTGRVCKNILGIFSNGAQETLEVKLRLMPVPNLLQTEYISHVGKYRELNQVIPDGFDVGAWSYLFQVNPVITQLAVASRSQSPAVNVPQSNFSALDRVHQTLSENNLRHSQEVHQEANVQYSSSHANFSCPPSRADSPVPNLQPTASFHQFGQSEPSRPTSSASAKVPSGQHHAISIQNRLASVDTGYISTDENSEEGPAKKRAKVTQAEWAGKNTFGKQTGSLRVAASSAASIRVYSPKPMRPSAASQVSLELPPRAPTPVPPMASQSQRRPPSAGPSHLRHESYNLNSNLCDDPGTSTSHHRKSISVDSNMTSSEESRTSSLSNTPRNIASSPPIVGNVSTAPSSPRLPTFRYDRDSGFMSGHGDDLGADGDDEMRPIDEEDLEIASQYSKRDETTLRNTGINSNPSTLPPNKKLPRSFKIGAKQAIRSTSTSSSIADITQKTQKDTQSVNTPSDSQTTVVPLPQGKNAQSKEVSTLPTFVPPATRPMERTASVGSISFPQVCASDPVRPLSSSLQRSATWSGQQIQHPATDAPNSGSCGESKRIETAQGGSRSGSGARRKKAIQDRLATSIASGEMPPYCENCGAIETPTWRKAWVRIHSGTPEFVRTSTEEGGIIAWEALERNQAGVITLFRIIKRSLLENDAGFTEILLCNREYIVSATVDRIVLTFLQPAAYG